LTAIQSQFKSDVFIAKPQIVEDLQGLADSVEIKKYVDTVSDQIKRSKWRRRWRLCRLIYFIKIFVYIKHCLLKYKCNLKNSNMFSTQFYFRVNARPSTL